MLTNLIVKALDLNIVEFCKLLVRTFPSATGTKRIKTNLERELYALLNVKPPLLTLPWTDINILIITYRVELEKDVSEPDRKQLLVILQNYIARDSLVQIKPSRIPKSGMGLIAQRRIEYKPNADDKYNRITEYGGIFGDNPIDADADYVIDPTLNKETTEYDYVLDGKMFFYMHQLGRWANDGRDVGIINAELVLSIERNQSKTKRPYTVWLVATQTIRRGEEIFVDYGPDYDFGVIKPKRRRCIECKMRPAGFKLRNNSKLVFCGESCLNKYLNLL